MKHNKITLIISFVLSLLLITIGLSFAYFTANITGTETSTTIQASGGVMNIHYDGGENITTPNIFPSNTPFAIKDFTLTGKSTTNDNMNYHIILVIEENTFTNNALQYKLISTNTDGNGTVAPSSVQSGIANGAHEIFLGDGTFESPANNKLHSYSLELYFPDAIKDQNDDMGKTFNAYINIREGEYNYPGYNEDKGVNHPVLFTGMTPVKWDENNEEINTTESDPDWYNYDEKRWANAKSQDGSYWVWIPRYAYKIESCYHMGTEECLLETGKEAGEIDIKFLKGTTNETEDKTKVETIGYEPEVKDTSMHHFLHPAFQFNGDEHGFWMAKFEPSVADQQSGCYKNPNLSNCNNLNNTVKIIPGAISWRYIQISTSFHVSLDMKNKTQFGWNSNEVDSHMIKNTEWGAVAYLSKSKYGAYEEEVWSNAYNKYVTGCSSPEINSSNINECIEYNTNFGVKASTTHNIYGVYDMSGGAWERVMANYNNLVGSSAFSSSAEISFIEPKYINKYYTSPPKMNNGIGMDYDKNIYGDAFYETSKDARKLGSGLTTGKIDGSWYFDYSFFPYLERSWINRGGYWQNTSISGLFAYHPSVDDFYSVYTFRPVLMPLKQANS